MPVATRGVSELVIEAKDLGISGARPGAHVHFALTVAEGDYDAMVAQIRAHGVHVDEVYFGDDPAA